MTLANLGVVVLQKGDSDANHVWGGQALMVSSDTPVSELQAALAGIGVLDGAPDGEFGEDTDLAVRRFQWYTANQAARLNFSTAAIVSFAPQQLANPGECDATTATEVLAWQTGGFVTTTPLVRLSLGQLGQLGLSDGFEVLEYPQAGENEVLVNAAFVSVMRQLNDVAAGVSVKLMLNQTFRRNDVPPSGAIVPPATKSQHLIGHAVDLNIKDGSILNLSGAFQGGHETAGALQFINRVKTLQPPVRWGGNFTPQDYVHFDDLVDPNSTLYDMSFFFAQRGFHRNHPMNLVTG